MRRLEEFVNEKLKVTKGNVPPDIPLGKQGWICTSANSIYNDIRLIDNFLKTDIDLERLEYINTEEYTKDKVIIFDKVFLALKRSKWCRKIINLILSEYSFDEGIERVQEILRNNAICKSAQSLSNTKLQVIKIVDSQRSSAMILTFRKQ